MAKTTERDLGRLEGKIDGVFTAIGEMKDSVIALRADFQSLEQGRLSRLEVHFAKFETEVQTKARSVGIWWGIATSITGSVVSGAILFILLK